MLNSQTYTLMTGSTSLTFIEKNGKKPDQLAPTNQSKSCLVKHEMLYVANYWSYVIDGYSILKHF